MKLFNAQNGCSQIRIPFIYHLIELDLEINTIFLLHIDYEVDTCNYNEREEDSNHNVKVEF
jgi:hypothetical protein